MSHYLIIEDNISIAGQLRRWANEADREGFAHTDEIIEGADRIEHLEKAFKEMPEVDIAFNSKKEMDMWNGWKAEYFNSEGELK